MPLQLGGIETKRKQAIIWDPDDTEEKKFAMKKIEELKQNGFSIISSEDGMVRMDPPKLNPNINVFRILSQNGDDRVIWDRRDKNQVKEAFQKFKELLNNGYTAYAVTEEGKRGHKITTFDPGLEEVILGTKETVFVPRTVPG